ncbi:MAG: hypothetical protein JXQ72_00135 [Anaerolineae bacterium]|nr:hypothetical protein [Anaerolineae bacterium]
MDNPKRFLRELVSGPAAIIVIIAFFMPWVTVSCEGYSDTVSGYDLTQSQSEEDVEEEGDIWLWIIPIVAAVVAGVVWARFQRDFDSKQAALIYIGAGIVGLIAQIMEYLDIHSSVEDAREQIGEVIDVTYKIGWWLTALGLIAFVVSGFLQNEEGPAPSGRQFEPKSERFFELPPDDDGG